MAAATETQPRVSVRGISKRFGGVQALDDVSLDVFPGSIHALLGENGAGKSTLVKILTGAVHPDGGTIMVSGREVRITSPRDAIRLGIAAVHQELNLFPDLPVVQNVFAGNELHDRMGFVRRGAMLDELKKIMNMVGWWIDLDQPVQALRLAERQMVEILRAFHLQADLILLDEPNSALTDAETQALFKMMRRFQAHGQSFLLVSHRLDEVFSIADHVTILRDGRRVASSPIAAMTLPEAVRLMVGSAQVARTAEHRALEAGAPIELDVVGATAAGFTNVSFHVRRGEIVGFAGLEGAGVQSLFATLFGLRKLLAGKLALGGKPYRPRSTAEAIARGVASIPADRRVDGLLMDRSVGENIVLVVLHRIMAFLGLVPSRRVHRTAQEYAKTFRLRAPSLDTPVVELSGGNQQKVVLAKWLAAAPRLLLLNDPGRGIDVGAKREVHDAIRRLAQSGMSILVWSSEAEETLELCDRILVMRKGALVKEVDPSSTSLHDLLLAVTGETEGAA
ncbi:MAG TPA: sugar ABC transporter ATP-binding protein [Candidatus Sulfotelmatobacter sp.]|nr:sugar ABC transporter ATP-binding protein [Candidatus Sulfotelmatobacter sp.]